MLKKINKTTLFVFFTAFIMYANTLRHDYAWDDSIVITENPYVQKGLSGIPDLFVKHNSDYKADKYGYRPITLASFAIDYGLFKNNAEIGHFMNVIYFGILCVVLFNVLRKVFSQYTSLPAFVITLLFIAHPIHVEVVANIKSRDEIFALLFALLSLGQMIDFENTAKKKHILYSALLLLIAFLSKESAIVFVVVIPLVLLYRRNWSDLKSMLKPTILSVILLLVLFCVMKFSSESTTGKLSSQGAGIYHENGILGNSFFYTDLFISKLANAFFLLLLYLKNFLFPAGLVYFYGYNQIPVANWTQPLIIISALLHSGAFVFALIKIKKHSEISLGILFYFISISIYLHLFRTLADTMADRFLFSPSVGLIIALFFAVSYLLKINLKTVQIGDMFSLNAKSKISAPIKYGLISILILLCITTFSRNKVWKNNETLIKNDLPKLENCSRAHSYYADILKTKLAISFDPNMEIEMIRHYKKSISISSEAYYSYIGLSTYFISTKRYDEAIGVLDTMLLKYSNQADPNFYKGQALYYKALYKQALPYLQKSLALAPEVSNTYFFLALTLSENKMYAEAEKTILISKSKFGENTSVFEALGKIYFDKGDIDQSTKYTFEMLKYGVDAKMVYSIVIGRYQTLKHDKLAAFYYQQALEKGVFKR